MKGQSKLAACVLFCALCLVSHVSASAPSVSARAAILIDAETGTVMYGKNENERLPMASTTKIMTALVVLENACLSDCVIIPQEAVGVEGSSVCIECGETLTVEELLYAMMLESANDAAAALAIHVGGSIDGFAEMMNERAKSIGLCDTSFANPHGLDDAEHYTSAHDLAAIAAEAMKNEDFSRIVSTYRQRIPYGESGYRYLMNHNKLLKLYDGALGVKTGFTKKSGRCLVSAAKRDEMTLIAVTLCAPDDWSDHTRLLDYGFENYEIRELAAPHELVYELDVIGKHISTLEVSNTSGASVCVRKAASELETHVYLPRMLWGKVEQGAMLGRVEYLLDGKLVASLPLIADDE